MATRSKWLVLVQTQLAFCELDRIALLARKYTGIQRMLDIASTVLAARSVGDALDGTADAYACMREAVKHCMQRQPRFISVTNACSSLLRQWRDVTVLQCARVVGIQCRTVFMQELDDAFGGLDRELSSQLQLSYAKILKDYDGAFSSRTKLLSQRRGWVRQRKVKGQSSTETATDDSAATSSSTVAVDVSTRTGAVECSVEGGAARLLGAPDSWWQTVHCVYGHETVVNFGVFRVWRWRCPKCNKRRDVAYGR